MAEKEIDRNIKIVRKANKGGRWRVTCPTFIFNVCRTVNAEKLGNVLLRHFSRLPKLF